MFPAQPALRRTRHRSLPTGDTARQIDIVARALAPALADAARDHARHGPRLILARGTPETIGRDIADLFPARRRPLLDDLTGLARAYGDVAGDPLVRLRLERITDDSCRKFHTDNVTIRMLCAYVGPGVQWLDRDETMHEVATGQIALLRGQRSGYGPGVLHRSPPLSHLPLCRRLRLLLTIDAPDACGLPADHTVTVVP